MTREKKACLGNLKSDCSGSCPDYKECLDKYMDMEMRASEHRRD